MIFHPRWSPRGVSVAMRATARTIATGRSWWAPPSRQGARRVKRKQRLPASYTNHYYEWEERIELNWEQWHYWENLYCDSPIQSVTKKATRPILHWVRLQNGRSPIQFHLPEPDSRVAPLTPPSTSPIASPPVRTSYA